MLLYWLLAAAVILLVVYWYTRGEKEVVGPKLPGVGGTSLTFRILKKAFWEEELPGLMETCPDMVCIDVPFFVRGFLGKRTYVLHEPEIVNEVMLKRGYKEFQNHPKTRSDNGLARVMKQDESLVAVRDEKWRSLRKSLTPSFHWANIKPMIPIFNAACKRSVTVLEPFVGKEEDITAYLHHLTIDTIGATAFGVEIEAVIGGSHPLAKALLDMTLYFSKSPAAIAIFIPYFEYLPLPPLQRFLQGYRTTMATARAVVNLRRDDPSLARDDLLQLLIEAKDEKGEDLSMDVILQNALLFLMAGEGTSSSTIGWVLAELARNPEAEQKVMDEIESVLGDDDPTDVTLGELKYLSLVVKETLRLHPAANITNRDCSEDTELAGHKFPAGTPFLIPIWILQNSPKYWKNPEEFRPERFGEDEKHLIVPNTYMPFGHGPRKCIGFRFASALVQVAVVHYLRAYRFRRAENKPVPTTGLSPNPKELKMIITPR